MDVVVTVPPGGDDGAAAELEAVLQSVSDALFPAALGAATVRIDSRGGGGDTPLHVLVWRGEVRGVECLIEAGADVNARGEMDETPLHVAVTQGNRGIIRRLIAAGADPDARCAFGDTARERARTGPLGLSACVERQPDAGDGR